MAQRPRSSVRFNTPFIPTLSSNLFKDRDTLLNLFKPPPPPPVVTPLPPVVNPGKSREEILYERYLPEENKNFFIVNTYMVKNKNMHDCEVCPENITTSEVYFNINKTDKVDLVLNTKCLRSFDPEIIITKVGNLNFEYYKIIVPSINLKLLPNGKPQNLIIRKNKKDFLKIVCYVDDALPPIANIKSFTHKIDFVDKILMFEAVNFLNTFCHKDHCYKIYFNDSDEEISTEVLSLQKNIFTVRYVYDSDEKINTIKLIVYNSKGELDIETISI